MNTLQLRIPTLCALALAASFTGSARDGVDVTFLANEGVLLASGDTKVLIDGLFLPYGDGFALPHDSTQRALHGARAPFDGIDVVLATHRHGDHFHPTPIATHLLANRGAAFIASGQTIDSLRATKAGEKLDRSQLRARSTLAGSIRTDDVNGVRIHALGIPHTGGFRHRHVDHLGFVVEIGGRRVLHLGDGEITEETMRPLRLDTMRIDVALAPSWVVESAAGAAVLRRWVAARQVVAFHLSDDANANAGVRRNVAVRYPGAIVFERSLERRRW